MFRSTMNKGFHMTFNNGILISVQWGSMNYCANRSYTGAFGSEMRQEITECSNAEIMIENSKGVTITHHFTSCDDQVAGHLSTNEVGKIIGQLQAMSQDMADSLKELSWED